MPSARTGVNFTKRKHSKIPSLGSKQGKSFTKHEAFWKELQILFYTVHEPVIGTWIIIFTSLPLHFTRPKKCPPTSTGMPRLKVFLLLFFSCQRHKTPALFCPHLLCPKTNIFQQRPKGHSLAVILRHYLWLHLGPLHRER